MSCDVIIPGEIMDRTDLNIGEKVLVGIVAGLSKKQGFCWASNQYLADRLQVKPRQIQKLVSKLTKIGVIRSRVLPSKRRKLSVNLGAVQMEFDHVPQDVMTTSHRTPKHVPQDAIGSKEEGSRVEDEDARTSVRPGGESGCVIRLDRTGMVQPPPGFVPHAFQEAYDFARRKVCMFASFEQDQAFHAVATDLGCSDAFSAYHMGKFEKLGGFYQRDGSPIADLRAWLDHKRLEYTDPETGMTERDYAELDV